MTAFTRDVTEYESQYKEFNSINSLLGSGESSSGLYGILHGPDVYTDLLYWNQHADVTIICFNGAGGPSSDIHPRFDGTSMFHSWKLSERANFVFVHDASLYLDGRLSTAWYAGSQDFPYLAQLEIILRYFVSLNDPDHLIFFGLSDGGHAALNYSAKFPGSIAVVGNPKTQVKNDTDEARNRYYDICWPRRENLGASGEPSSILDMNAVYARGTDNFAYCLANASDQHHVEDHLVPFVEAARPALNVRTLVRHWGNGHATCPPHDFLGFFEELVTRRKDGEIFPDVRGARLLESGEDVHAVINYQGSPAASSLFDGEINNPTAVTFSLSSRVTETVDVVAHVDFEGDGPVTSPVEFVLDPAADRRHLHGLRPTADGYDATFTYRSGSPSTLRTYFPADLRVRALRLHFPSDRNVRLTRLELTSHARFTDCADVPGTPRSEDTTTTPGGKATSAAERDVLTVDEQNVPRMDPEVFPPDVPVRIDVRTAACVIPLLIIRRASSDKLVVFSNGAVDLTRSERAPLFQRSTWWEDVHGHQVFVCDPGTVGNNALSLSWGQLGPDYWAIPDISRTVKNLAKVIGVAEPENRTYFGSSGGGFMSVALCHFDPGARAVVNNAQLDWTRWMSGAVNTLRAARFDNMLPADIRTSWPERTSVLRLLASGDVPARVDYLVNLASPHDRAVDLVAMREFMSKHPRAASNIRVFEYEDETAGHNPLSKDIAVACINGDPAAVELPGL